MSEIGNYQQSKLEIAGIDLRILGLHKLRANLGIIPQSSFLFTETIRRNLDPLNQYQDDAFMEGSNKFNFSCKKIQKGTSDLYEIEVINLLSKSYIKQKKIIVLDEATANVDINTDDFILETLKKKFNDCTLIAHRLNTDKFDSLFNLMAQSSSSLKIDKSIEFSELVTDTGDQKAQAIFDMGKQKFFNMQL